MSLSPSGGRQMKKKSFIVLLLALSGVGAFVWRAVPPRDPVCNGMRLSEWLRKMDWNESTSPIHKSDLQALGPSGIRYIAYTARRTAPRDFRMPRALRPLIPNRMIPSLTRRGSSEESNFAISVLGWLSDQSECARSELISMMDDTDPSISMGAVMHLNERRPLSWPEVSRVLDRKEPAAKKYLLRSMLTRVRLTNDLPQEADLVSIMALLRKGFHDSNSSVRVAALQTYSGFIRHNIPESICDSAIPDLTALRSDPDNDVRKESNRAFAILDALRASQP